MLRILASVSIAILALFAGCATGPNRASMAAAFTTPKLEVLNQQIQRNPDDAQAYSNRGYTLALLGRKSAARADLQKAVAPKNNGPMHTRVGWPYFTLGDYPQAVREFEEAA